ncbi:MAG: recombination protein O N-terminal domain-containing protein [bacterium]
MTANTFSTDAILLTKKKFGDGHVNLCLLTDHFGLIRVCAFGGQRLSKRFKGGIEYFQIFEAEIQITTLNNQQNYNLSCIKSVKERFASIPTMMEKYVAVSYVQEMSSMLLNQLERNNLGSSSYFNQVVECISKINSLTDKNNILDEVYNLSISLYQSTGFIPEIECSDSNNTKLCRLENFNSNILEKSPKSFTMLSNLYS